MISVRRAVVVAAMGMMCLGACGDDSPTPVDAGSPGSTEVMTDKTDSMTDGTEKMTDGSEKMTDGSEKMTDGTEKMSDGSSSTTAG